MDNLCIPRSTPAPHWCGGGFVCSSPMDSELTPISGIWPLISSPPCTRDGWAFSAGQIPRCARSSVCLSGYDRNFLEYKQNGSLRIWAKENCRYQWKCSASYWKKLRGNGFWEKQWVHWKHREQKGDRKIQEVIQERTGRKHGLMDKWAVSRKWYLT